MTRRQLLSLPAAASLLPGCHAQSAYPGVGYRQYSRCLPDFLRALAKEAFERRNHALAALTDSESIASRQRWAQETFWKLAGGMPERTPLNARTLGSFERQGYRV